MKKYEYTGKNVEEAIKNGLKDLNKSQEDVDIKIISNGGLFKKAKVEILVDEPELNVEEIADNLEKEITKNGGKVYENSFFKVTTTEIVDDGKTVKVTKDVKEQVNDEKPVETHEEKEFDSSTLKEITVSSEEMLDYLREYLVKLTELMGVKSDVLITEDDDKITAKIKNEDASKLVGYHGDCLNSIQVLANAVMAKKYKKCKRIFVNVENYREKREESLKSLADRFVKKVVRTGRPQKLNPMNSYERRIVHTYLQDNKNVYTKSSGVEPKRYLVIYPNGYEGQDE